MMSLTLEQLLAPRKRQPRAVPADEIEPGAVVYVYDPAGNDRDRCEVQWSRLGGGPDSREGFRVYICAWFLADAANKRLIDSGPDENDVPAHFVNSMQLLGEAWPCSLVSRFFDAACDLAGLTGADVEELAKNSPAIHAAAGNGSRPKPQESAAVNG